MCVCVCVGFDVEGLIKVFVGLLHQPGLASSLRQHREEVLAAALQFSVNDGDGGGVSVCVCVCVCVWGVRG